MQRKSQTRLIYPLVIEYSQGDLYGRNNLHKVHEVEYIYGASADIFPRSLTALSARFRNSASSSLFRLVGAVRRRNSPRAGIAAISGFSITVTCGGGVAVPCSPKPIVVPVLDVRRVERCDIRPPPDPWRVPFDASAAFAAAVRLRKRLVGSPVLTYHPPSGASSSESEAGMMLESARWGEGGRGGGAMGDLRSSDDL